MASFSAAVSSDTVSMQNFRQKFLELNQSCRGAPGDSQLKK
jgi:hypothetical protein